MDNAEFDAFFGVDVCRFLNREFMRKYLRVNLTSDEFIQEIFNSVAASANLQIQLTSPDFWIKKLNVFDAKYLINKRSVKSNTTWLAIVKKFFDILNDALKYKLNQELVTKMKDVINIVFETNNFNSPSDLIAHLENSFQITMIQPSNAIAAQEEGEEMQEEIATNDDVSLSDECEVTLRQNDVNNNSNASNTVSLKESLNMSSSTENDVSHEKVSTDDENLDTNNLDQISIDHNLEDQPPAKSDESNFDKVPDSIEVGKSRYFSRKRTFVPVNEANSNNNNKRQSYVEAREELKSLMRSCSAMGSKPDNNYKGKKIQLRNTKPYKNGIKRFSVSEVDEMVGASTMPDDDNDDDNASVASSSLSVRSTVSQLYGSKLKNAYTLEEDLNILKYIIKNRRYAEIKGNQLWKDMEENKVNHGRSWQSMKERFRKTIAANLQTYVELHRFDENEIDILQENICYVAPSSSTRQNSESKKDTLKAASNVYSMEEDEEILKFMFANCQDDKILGRSIWQKVEKHFATQFINRKRTWQSLMERFKKRICPTLYNYDNVPDLGKALVFVDKCCSSLDTRNKVKNELEKRFNKKKN